MGVDRSSYRLSVEVPLAEAKALDREYLMFRLLKAVPHASRFLEADGSPTGNEGYWDNLADAFKPFSKLHPTLLFVVEEEYLYEDTVRNRHYIRDGRSTMIEPVTTWPEFSFDMLA
jgi:hypothetical protein